MKKFVSYFLIISFTLFLTACSGFFDKDNTPPPAALTQYQPEIKPRLLWTAKAGSGSRSEHIKLAPAINREAIYTSSTNGVVTSINRLNGQIKWQINTRLPITTGPGVGNDMVVVGTQKGQIAAFNQANGQLRWEKNIAGELLASPAIAQNVVVVKTMDGMVRGLSTDDGEQLWSYQLSEPTLVLRGASSPLVERDRVMVGFANGKLAKLSLKNGNPDWLQTITIPEGAFSIQRMTDIDADPIAYNQHIYTATFQGKIAALDWYSGRARWTHKISSYTGMSADENSVYISDANSHVWSFGADDGNINWHQNQLDARGITGPAVIGKYVVVGDSEGYLHWMNAETGRLVAREHIGSAVSASPIAKNGVLYALTNSGNLVAYSIS